MYTWSKKRKIIVFLLVPFFVLALLLSLTQIIAIQNTYRESALLYDTLTRHLEFAPLGHQRIERDLTEVEEVFVLPEHIQLPEVDFAALKEINPDIVAWIILEGTPIHYPVVQGENNTHYLNHLFDGRRNAAGAIFVDSYNQADFTDRNTIIYGHHMRDGSMFAVLERFSSQEFFEEHPYVFLLTPQGNYVIQLLAGYTANVSMSGWQLGFDGDMSVEEWIGERRERSDFISEIETRPTDRFVTLSTCSWAFYDARYVVVGRLIPIA